MSMVDKYKDAEYEGWYQKDGCTYTDIESFIATGLFGFCGCGNNESAIEYVYKAMCLVWKLKTVVWEKKLDYEIWRTEIGIFFNSDDGAEYFMWYFLDNAGLTEHGGSVPGWLTADGEELLDDIERHFDFPRARK